MNAVSLIVKKRDGNELSSDEIRWFVGDYVAGRMPDYQMSAWLMAAFLRGLTDRETLALTESMLHSGRVLSLDSVSRPKIDKHSTGGVGDKISLSLAPAVAACGVAVPMVCGRGLGHTGGTIDKLESIAGYETHLDAERFERIVATVGVSMMGQTREIAPADARIYALRDVTGTVDFIPFIVASILSKKLAEGIDGLVLDVKVGSGAFMKDLAAARKLADALVAVGALHGKNVSALLTDMSSPIGSTIGNALEVKEALQVLHGRGPEDTVELTVELGAEMLARAGVGSDREDRLARIRGALADGSALDVFRRMVVAHGGDARMVDAPERLPTAPHRVPVPAPEGGVVRSIDAFALGLLAVSMGAGRTRAEDPVDPAVGIELRVRPGDPVTAGEPLAWLHARTREVPPEWLEAARSSVVVGDRADRPGSRILERRG
jgi:pyrimidine-nucleoside phosphorylase